MTTTNDIKMESEDLYLEETFTDRKVGTIRRLTPVNPDGLTDTKRPAIYVGQAQILTPMGAVPLTFELEANSLSEACEKFADAADVAVEETKKEIEDMRREAASSIVVPPGADAGLPGGIPGRIKMP